MNFCFDCFTLEILSCPVRNVIGYLLIFTALVFVKLMLEEGILFAVFIFTTLKKQAGQVFVLSFVSHLSLFQIPII